MKSNMSKKFDEHKARGLRCMADGGLVGNRMQRMEQIAGATMPVALSANPGMASMASQPQPQPQPIAASPAPVAQPMSAEEAEWQRIKAEKLAPKPTLMSNVKKVFGFADGGTLRSVSSKIVPNDPNAMKVRTLTGQIGVRGADGGKAKDMIKTHGLRGALRHTEVHEGPGMVYGPGTRTNDKVPAMLSNEEAVLPGDTVEAIGGEEGVNALIAATHTPVNKPNLRNGVMHAANGVPPRFGDLEMMRPVQSLPAPVAAPAAPPVAAPNSSYDVGKRIGESVRNIGAKAGAARGLVGSAVATAPLFGFGDYKIDDPGVDSSLMGTLRAAGNQISSAFKGTALPSDREATQATLRKGAVEAGLDSMSGLTKTFDAVTGLVGLNPDTSGDLARTVQNDLGGAVRTPSSTPAAPVPDFSNVKSGSSTTAGARPAQPTDWEGRGAPLQTRAGREAQLRAAYAPTQYEPTDNRSLRERDPAGFDMPARTIGEAIIKNRDAKRGLRTQRLQMELDQRERDSVRQYGAAAERNAVTLRGQDMTAKTAGEAAVRDQANKDRQYKLDVAKYGDEQAKSLQQRRESGAKATQERIASMIPPSADGKPDAVKTARYMTGLNAALGNKIAQTKAHLAKNPGDAQAKAWLEKAESEGMGAMDDESIRKFVSGMEAKELAEQEHSNWNPFGGTAVNSDAPVTSMKLKKGFIFDDYVTDRGDVIPARSVNKRDGLRNTNMDILKGR